MPRGPLLLSFFSPKFYTVLGHLYCFRLRDSYCPRSSLIHIFNKHSLGTSYELTTLGYSSEKDRLNPCPGGLQSGRRKKTLNKQALYNAHVV